MRVHLLSVPNTCPTDAFPLDGFNGRTKLFAELLKRLGHTVILYGAGPSTTVPCDEYVMSLTDEQRVATLGGIPYQALQFDGNHPLFVTFNALAARHIRSVKQPGDLVCTIAGSAQHFIADMNPDLLFLEYSVGYRGITAAHRVYQSHIWRHTVYGFTGVDMGREFDAVIYPWFHEDDFPASRPEPYVVYCGRLVITKGLQIACEAARRAGKRLIVMGHGDPQYITYGEYVKEPTDAERNLIFANAAACLVPTQYVEPFGQVAAEAMLCGTPVITSDYGAFVETNEQGLTGFRCTTMGEYVQALERLGDIDRAYVRRRARRLFGFDTAVEAYRRYLAKLATLPGQAWQDLSPTLPIAQPELVTA